MLDDHNILPGMQTFIRNVQRDEARHVGYGVFLLSRLIAEHGDPVWEAIDRRMGALLPTAIAHIEQTLAPYGDQIPFGVRVEDFVEIGLSQFQKRSAHLERARDRTPDEIYYDRTSPSSSANPEAGTTSVSFSSK